MRINKMIFPIMCVLLIVSHTSCTFYSGSQMDNNNPLVDEQSYGEDKSRVIEIQFPDYKVGDEPTAAVYDEIIDRYNTLYEGEYKIIRQKIPDGAAYVDKIKLLHATNNLPPFIDLGKDRTLGEIIINDQKVIDLKPYFDNSEILKKNSLPESIIANTIDGKMYGFPNTEDAYLSLWYNKKLFDQAEISEFPTNWGDFINVCDKLKSEGIVPLSLMTQNRGYSSMLMATAYIADYSTEGRDWLNTIYPYDFNHVPVIKGMQVLQKLFKYTTEDAIGGNYRMAINAFLEGETAMMANGPWMASECKVVVNGESFIDNLGVALFPGDIVIGFRGTSLGWGITDSASPEQVEGLIKYLELLSSDEIVQYKCTELGMISPSVSLTDEQKQQLDKPTQELFHLISNEVVVTIPNYQNQWDTVVAMEIIPQKLPLLANDTITPSEFCIDLTEGAIRYHRIENDNIGDTIE